MTHTFSIKPEIYPLGDKTLIVRVSPHISRDSIAAAVALRDALLAQGYEGLEELVPAQHTLAIGYDPLAASFATWRERIVHIVGALPMLQGSKGGTYDIPVCYGGEYGPDLTFVATAAGLTEEEVIRAHSEAEYTVAMIGFVPGFPYLLGLPEQLAVPRMAQPRNLVPAGSVAIGGNQTGIYPSDIPGGWRILGRTPIQLFDANQPTPSLLRPGDTVRFTPIDELTFVALAKGRC